MLQIMHTQMNIVNVGPQEQPYFVCAENIGFAGFNYDAADVYAGFITTPETKKEDEKWYRRT